VLDLRAPERRRSHTDDVHWADAMENKILQHSMNMYFDFFHIHHDLSRH
jgi:hypothetical protein